MSLESNTPKDLIVTDLIDTLSNQIVTAHPSLDDVVFVGILSTGFPIAERLAKRIKDQTQIEVPVGKLDVSLYRDDLIEKGSYITLQQSEIPVNLTDKVVVLVDDVLFHGRTIRAAMDGILDFGRPKRIECAVLIDRGHRELPIEATYVGETISTQSDQYVKVSLLEVEGEDGVILTDESKKKSTI